MAIHLDRSDSWIATALTRLAMTADSVDARVAKQTVRTSKTMAALIREVVHDWARWRPWDADIKPVR